MGALVDVRAWVREAGFADALEPPVTRLLAALTSFPMRPQKRMVDWAMLHVGAKSVAIADI